MRNIFCPHYRRCLDQAIDENNNGFDCSLCKHRKLKTGIDPIEHEQALLLLVAAFNPEFYRELQKG